jgi:phage terminase large subunit-like protein
MAKLNPWWIPAPWLQYLSLEIARCVATGNCGLLISAPPRHGKSMLSTVATPLWVLENMPHKSVVVSTYGEDLSTDFSRQIRDAIQNNQDILNVRLRGDTQRVQNFLTTKGGGLKAVGLRGAITGRGADVFVLDDYIKEPKEAMSPTYLEDLWTWYLTVARTRLEPGAVVIILATRWVADDLHGRIKAKQKQTGRTFFKYIEMPAIYEPMHPDPEGKLDASGKVVMVPDYEQTDMLGRHYGDVLFPERYTRESILDIKLDLTSRWFNAMFQQKPDAEENVTVNLRWFRLITREEFNLRLKDWKEQEVPLFWGRGWDMASTKEAGDYTAGARALWVKRTEDFYIESMKRGQWSAATAESEFAKAVIEDTNLDPDFKFVMEQEPGSSGKYSVRHFEKLGREEVPGISLKEAPATQSKLLRASSFLAGLEHGHVYIIVDHEEDLQFDNDTYAVDDIKTEWVREFFSEAKLFPEAPHDDQMDAVALNYINLSGKLGLKASIGRMKGKDITGMVGGRHVSGESPTPNHRRGATFGRRGGFSMPSSNGSPRRSGGGAAFRRI